MRTIFALFFFAVITPWLLHECLNSAVADEPAKSAATSQSDLPSANFLLNLEDYPKFRLGRAKSDILNDIQWRGNFEMATKRNGHELCAISYGINGGPLSEHGAEVWAIFIDNKFDKFVPFPMHNSTWDKKRMKIGDFNWLFQAADNDSVNLDVLDKQLKATKSPSQVDPGLTAMAVIVAPVLTIQHHKETAKNQKLRNQFNAARLSLGLTTDEVEAALDSRPIQTGNLESGEYKIYGSTESIALLPDIHYSNVVVLFEDGRATAIYAGSSVPEEKGVMSQIKDGFIFWSDN